MRPHITDVTMDTCYSCKSNDMIEADLVNQTLWNVLIQAFVNNGSKSEKCKCGCSITSHSACNMSLLFTLIVYSLCFVPHTVTSCAADLPTTAVVPTTHSTNTTTAAPVTNTTTPLPTTTPTPTLPTPSTGKYSIKPDENGTACLLASFGLRIGYKQADVCLETEL